MPGGRILQLTPDQLFAVSLAPSPAFQNFVGRLDGSGHASPQLLLPNVPGVQGLPVYAGAFTVDLASSTLIRQISDPVRWTL